MIKIDGWYDDRYNGRYDYRYDDLSDLGLVDHDISIHVLIILLCSKKVMKGKNVLFNYGVAHSQKCEQVFYSTTNGIFPFVFIVPLFFSSQ